MGSGDELMGAGLARGAHARGRWVAFGDGKRIIWGPAAAEIYRGNPNVAAPGSEINKAARAALDWIEHYPSKRAYNRNGGDRWVWNYEFKAKPGEVYFDERERRLADGVASGFVLIEPNVPQRKSVAPNKQWPVERYQRVVDVLVSSGTRVVQLDYGGRYRLNGCDHLATRSFRDALAVLSRASLLIGPEGGMHHGAAALGVKAIVLFGGFIPPQVTGYDMHVNLTGGAEACGSMYACEHCREAMNAISVDDVLMHAA